MSSQQPNGLTEAQLELMQRVTAYQLDDPASAVPFSARLAKEQRWKVPFAKRVCEEYKRFAYLAVVAGHPVTPSKAVDEAWHLHLIYSEKYWKEFCGTVLGQPLHHHPGSGEHQEGPKFHQQYANTVASYRRFFRENPPRDIWPEPKVVSDFRTDAFATGARQPDWDRLERQSQLLESGAFDRVAGERVPPDNSKLVVFATLGVIGLALTLMVGFSETLSIGYHLIEDPSPLGFLIFFGGSSIALLALLKWAESGENPSFTSYLHALFGLLLAAGLFRLAVGANAGRPVGYLLGMLVCDVLGWLWVADLLGGPGSGGDFFSCGGSSCGGGGCGGGCGG